MESTGEIYESVRENAGHLYSKTDPVKFSVFAGSTATALYAAADPSSPEWVDAAGHMATGSFGSSLTDIAYDVLEVDDEDEMMRKPMMVVAGLACGNITQGFQSAGIVSGSYDLTSVAEAGLAATANALGTEEHEID